MSEGAGDEDTDIELVATTLQAVANPHRIQLLLGLYRGQARAALVDQLPISESGVTNHLRALADAGLVYRSEEGWQVSPLGTFVATFLDAHGDVVADARRRIRSARAEASSEYEDVPLPDQERDRTVEWRTWDLVHGELEDLFTDRLRGVDGTTDRGDNSKR